MNNRFDNVNSGNETWQRPTLTARGRYRNYLSSTLIALAILFCTSSPAYADWARGHINILWADPSDVVFVLDGVNGECGHFFVVHRSNVNFSEFSALLMTAFAQRKEVDVNVVSCQGDRNVVSHGSMHW